MTEPGTGPGTGDRAWFRFRYRFALVVPVPVPVWCEIQFQSGPSRDVSWHPLQVLIYQNLIFQKPITKIVLKSIRGKGRKYRVKSYEGVQDWTRKWRRTQVGSAQVITNGGN